MFDVFPTPRLPRPRPPPYRDVERSDKQGKRRGGLMQLKLTYFGMFMSLPLEIHLVLSFPIWSFYTFSGIVMSVDFNTILKEGIYDLVRFVKAIQKAGLCMHFSALVLMFVLSGIFGICFCDLLRSNTNFTSPSLINLCIFGFRGFPVWLKYVRGISFKIIFSVLLIYFPSNG